MDCFAALAMTVAASIAHRMPSYTETTHVNPAVTSFVYAPPTISPACRGPVVERVAYHVAFRRFWPRLFHWPLPRCSRAADGWPARIPASTSATHRSRSPPSPGRPTCTSVSPTIRPRDRAGADHGERRSGRFRRGRRHRQRRRPALRRAAARPPRSFGRGRGHPRAPRPSSICRRMALPITGSSSRSKTFTARDAAALIVGAGDGPITSPPPRFRLNVCGSRFPSSEAGTLNLLSTLFSSPRDAASASSTLQGRRRIVGRGARIGTAQPPIAVTRTISGYRRWGGLSGSGYVYAASPDVIRG